MFRLRFVLPLCLIWLFGAAPLAALPLWELEGTGNQIRLLGSIHFLRPSDFPLPKAMKESFDDADVIVMELDLTRIDPVESLMLIQRLAVDPDGESLSGALGPSSYRTAKRKAASIDIDLTTLQPYEPWFAALTITQLRLVQLGFDASHGLEARLTEQATQAGKPIRGLESMEEQLDALDSLPPQSQKVFLMQTLDEAAAAEEQLDNIITAWKSGDIEALEDEMLGGMMEQPELYDRILVRRNRNWTAQISELVGARDNYLIVVGTLHLIGDDSVLNMLDDAGYSSRQIR